MQRAQHEAQKAAQAEALLREQEAVNPSEFCLLPAWRLSKAVLHQQEITTGSVRMLSCLPWCVCT